MRRKLRQIIVLLGIASLIFLAACAKAGKHSEEREDIKNITEGEVAGEITINVYEIQEWLEMAVQMFEEKYPDTKINISPFFTETVEYEVENGGISGVERPAGQTREDYVKWLNTQLMSGNAGDVIITSTGLAVEKYENMGVFEDLSPYLEMAEEINEDNCNMNILEAYRTETGELYQFPVSAMASPLFAFNKKIVEETGKLSEIEGKVLTWREALTLAEEMYDTSDLPGKCMPEARTILGNIFTKEVVASVDYVNHEVNLHEKELTDILEAIEEFDYYDTFGWSAGNENFSVFGLEYTIDTDAASMQIQDNSVTTQWKNVDGRVYLSPYFAVDFGISSQSENKILAWEFLRFLLSDEVQTLPSFPNAGINKNALKARVEDYCNTNNMPEKSEEMLQLVSGWISEINGYHSEDTDLIQIGDAIFSDFMNGDLTVEEAVEEVEIRLEQYLSE